MSRRSGGATRGLSRVRRGPRRRESSSPSRHKLCRPTRQRRINRAGRGSSHRLRLVTKESHVPSRLRGAAVAAASILSLAVAIPAHADSRTFSDPNGDAGIHDDITTVKVANGSGGGARVAVRADVGPVHPGDFFTFWFDTRFNDPGPEYKVVVNPGSDGIELRRLEEFGDSGTSSRGKLRASADVFSADDISVSVPRSCMDNPGSHPGLATRPLPRRWSPSQRLGAGREEVLRVSRL